MSYISTQNPPVLFTRPGSAAGSTPNRVPTPATFDRLRTLTQHAALAGIVVGATSLLLTLIDCLFGLSCPAPLAQVQLSSDPAAALAALGIALYAVEPAPMTTTTDVGDQRSRWVRVAGCILALFVAVFGMVHLVRGGGGLPWDDDQFISSAWFIVSSVAPGNALGFVLVGLSILFLDANSRILRLLSTGMALTGGVVAALVILGRLFNILTTPSGSEEPMMPGAALTLAFLCTGVLCARPNREPVVTIASKTQGGTTARRLLSAVLLLPILGWLCLRGFASGLYGANAVVALFSSAALSGFGVLIWWNARRLRVVDSERQKAERALRASEERYRLLFENNPLPMWVYDSEDRRFLAANDAAVAHYGYTSEQFLGMTIDQLWPVQGPEGIASSKSGRETGNETDIIRDSGGLRHSYGKHRRSNGELISVEVTSIDADFLNNGRPARLLLAHDVTEREMAAAQTQAYNRALERQSRELQIANERLKTLATRDGLTGLFNHRFFYEQLSGACASASRYICAPFSILLIDVDRFKQYNDDFGHPAGDVVLQKVAEILESCSRPTDTVARYGGEEFAILLPGADFHAAASVAERIRRAVEVHEWTRREITVSVGTATLASDLTDGPSLVHAADSALYVSKRDGRNRITVAAENRALSSSPEAVYAR